MLITVSSYLAILGIGIVIFASGVAALDYRGARGERYSPLNHFVSELGELAVSSRARLFNLGVILGGLLLLPFILSLAWKLDSWLGWLGMLAGVIAALALSAVGLFPMDNLERHTRAAMTFFRAGLVMVFFFGLAILFQPGDQIVVPKSANLLSLLAGISYASFLSLTRPKPADDSFESLDPNREKERPRIWHLAIVEWILFFATVFWVLGISIISL
jgi:hypothetical membrane protein